MVLMVCKHCGTVNFEDGYPCTSPAHEWVAPDAPDVSALAGRVIALTAERDGALAQLEQVGGLEGHNEPCYYCKKLCSALAGNPSQWPIPLCHADEPGRVKWHHIGCVDARLAERDAWLAAAFEIACDEPALLVERLKCLVADRGKAQAEVARLLVDLSVVEKRLGEVMAERDEAQARFLKAREIAEEAQTDAERCIALAAEARAERDEMRRKLEPVDGSDVEHQIACHADTLPDYTRSLARSLAELDGVLNKTTDTFENIADGAHALARRFKAERDEALATLVQREREIDDKAAIIGALAPRLEELQVKHAKVREHCAQLAESQAPDVDDNTTDEYRRGQRRSALCIAALIRGYDRSGKLT